MLFFFNDTAYHFANLGRAKHKDVKDLIMRTRARFNAIKNWAAWIGHATQLQYSEKFPGCDHDLRSGAKRLEKDANHKVRTPKEARILRRMPWARNCFGAVEYTHDLWLQDHEPVQSIAPAVATNAAANGGASSAERRYIEAFHVKVGGGCDHKTLRVVPSRVDSEKDCWLKPRESLGHVL